MTPAAPPTEMPELLPCPFCGGIAAIEEFMTSHDFVRNRWVQCSECNATGPRLKTPNGNFLNDWNRRYVTTNPYTERERMLAEVVIVYSKIRFMTRGEIEKQNKYAPIIDLAAEIVGKE